MAAGEATNTLHLCEQLSRRGVEVEILTGTSTHGRAAEGLRIRACMEKWSWSEAPRLIGAVRQSAADSVLLMYIGWTYCNHPMMTFAPTICRRVLPRARFVTEFQNVIGAPPTDGLFATKVVRKAVKWWVGSRQVDYEFGTLLRDSDRVIVLSANHLAKLARHSSDVVGKSIVIPPPPNMRMWTGSRDEARRRSRERLGVRADEFLVAYIGYIYPGKGLETLLEALGLLIARRENVRLAVIGGTIAAESLSPASYGQSVQQLAVRLGVSDWIRWTGEYTADSDEASMYLYGADACVLPFDSGVQLNNSSFSSAAAHGLAIITTRGTMLEDAFVDGHNVLLCSPKRPEALATRIAEVMRDAGLRQRLSEGARRLGDEWFAWDSAVERTLAALS